MRKLASITVATAFAGLLLGAAVATSSAASASGGQPSYHCSNVGIGVQVVNCGATNVLNGNAVKVVVTDNHVLSGNQINILQNSLNNVTVNVNPEVYFLNLVAVVKDVYVNVFGIVIADNQVLCSYL